MVRITLNIVVIGGGTGSSVVLKGLKRYDCNLYTIVPMGDSGGSSGRLREDFGVLSAGEIRQRLTALADENELANILDYRLEKGRELKGHTLGNILIAGLAELTNSQEKSIEILSKLVKAKGKIIPSTWDRFELVADYSNGKKIIGEHFIDESKENTRIVRLYTQPLAKANPQAIEAIKSADVLIFGPGDFYTSVLHNIVVEGIPEAIRESKAKKIFICNLMTSPGETTGMTLQDLLDELNKYIGAKVIETVIINSKKIPPRLLSYCESNGQLPVNTFLNEETKQKVEIWEGDVIAEELYKKSSSDVLERSLLRHDSDKLGALIIRSIESGLNR